MTMIALALMAIVFSVFAALLTAIESGLMYFPRHDAEVIAEHSKGKSLSRLLANPMEHLNALRFWRVWFEMASAVAVALLLVRWLENEWIAGLIATVVMAAIGFVLVGISPRRLGRVHAATLVGRSAWLVVALRNILGPMPRWFVRLSGVVAKSSGQLDEAFVSEEEFREFVERASESDMIEENEAELIQSVIELGETMVRAVMVPRTDIRSIEMGSSLQEAMDVFLDSGFSRIPVIGDSADHIVGILYLKDVVATVHRLEKFDAGPRVESLARKVRYVPESKPVDDLLKELQQESTHVAIVVDEYGGTAGLVTLEDLLEEIVGEISDEYDHVSEEVQALGDDVFRVRARMAVDELGELFDKDLEDDEVDTVGGLLAKHLGRLPAEGSTVDVQGITLVAETMEPGRNRVSYILASRAPNAAEYESSEAEANHRGNSADESHISFDSVKEPRSTHE